MKKRYYLIVFFIMFWLNLPIIATAQDVLKQKASEPDISYQDEKMSNRQNASGNDPLQDKENFWDFVCGTAPSDAVYLGMFTWHFNPESRRDDRWINNLVGGVYHSIFFGTFLNSFSDRAFVAGIQRNLYTYKISQNASTDVGYRLGIISGYDKRMADIAEYLPVLPFPELYVDYAYKNFGAEISYVGVVLTTKFFIRF